MIDVVFRVNYAMRLILQFVICNIDFAAHLQSMIELSRTQDEEVGDGTTSVIILGYFLSSNFEHYSISSW